MKAAIYWRHRAEAIRTIRDDTRSPKARATLARLAADYDRLAHISDPADHEALMIAIAEHYADLTSAGHVHE